MKDGLNVSTFLCCQLFVFIVLLIPWCIVSLLKALINLKQHNYRSNIQLYRVLTKNYSISHEVPICTWRSQEGIPKPNFRGLVLSYQILKAPEAKPHSKTVIFLSNLWGARYLCCCPTSYWDHSLEGWRLYQIIFVPICCKLIN